jgi:SAM-dependent methyltransferase
LNDVTAHYERPALRALAGEVAGLDVLEVAAGDATCGWLADGGARAVTIDALATDLREPLPVLKESIDLVVSSLALHFVLEWEPLFREFRRVTKPSGALVFSTHHPCMGLHDGLGVDYFTTGMIEDDTRHAKYWRRPLAAVISSLIETGWRIEKLVEPRLADAVDPWLLLIRAAR